MRVGWWRWFLVPLGAVAGALLFPWIVQIAASTAQARLGEDSWFYTYAIPGMYLGFVGFGFSFGAGLIAPWAKQATSLIAAGLYIVAAVGFTIWAWPGASMVAALSVLVNFIAIVVGCFIAVATVPAP